MASRYQVPAKDVISGEHKPNPENLVTIPGYQTATDFFRHQLLRELRIRLGQGLAGEGRPQDAGQKHRRR